MYEFIEGEIVQKTPASVVIKDGGMAYLIHISLHSFSTLSDPPFQRLYLHQVVREDAHILYGFTSPEEREIFRQLLSVSGIGPNTARIILSSLSPDEVREAILQGNVPVLQGIKGIGAKTAQRVIVDLKDKIGKSEGLDELFLSERNTIREEALSALVALGFGKKQVEKAVGKLLSEKPAQTVEELIKEALKLL